MNSVRFGPLIISPVVTLFFWPPLMPLIIWLPICKCEASKYTVAHLWSFSQYAISERLQGTKTFCSFERHVSGCAQTWNTCFFLGAFTDISHTREIQTIYLVFLCSQNKSFNFYEASFDSQLIRISRVKLSPKLWGGPQSVHTQMIIFSLQSFPYLSS